MTDINRGRRVRKFTWLFLGIVRDFWKEARLASKIGGQGARDRMSKRHRKRAIQFRETSIEMGGVLIKLGQFFSARVDIMPDEYIQELTKLQDTVPEIPFEEIRKRIEADFGRPLHHVYKEFNKEALAAASLAQVHLAKLDSGEKVAVKVLRPGIEELVDIDLATFAYLMKGVKRFTRFGKRTDIDLIVSEFVRTLGDELDFYREGCNAIRFREMFKDSKTVYIPKIYQDYTTAHVLTLEAIDGIKISHYEEREVSGIDRHAVDVEGFQSYLKQVLEEGFFHADPHPGNLFVSAGPVIKFVDFGMVGEITEEMKLNLRDAIVGIAKKDAEIMVDAFEKLGFFRPGADRVPVINALNWMFDKFETLNTKNLSYDNLVDIEEDIIQIIHDQPITVPANFAFLGRALSTLLGLSIGLDPDFDFVSATKPYVDKMLKPGSKEMMGLITDEIKSMGQIFLGLPKQINDAMSKINKGELSVKVDAQSVTRALRRGNRRGRITAQVIAFMALLISAVTLFYLDFPTEAYFFSAISLVFAFSIIRK